MNNQVNRGSNIYCILGFIFSFVNPIAGLPLSIIGLNQIKKTFEPGREFAIAGIWVSSIMLFLLILMFLIFMLMFFIGLFAYL